MANVTDLERSASEAKRKADAAKHALKSAERELESARKKAVNTAAEEAAAKAALQRAKGEDVEPVTGRVVRHG